MENRKQKEENEMEIDLVSLFFYLIDKWKLLFLGAVVGVVLAGALVFFQTPMYESNSTLYVLSKTTSITSITIIVVYISQFDIFKADRVLYHVDSTIRETGNRVDDGLYRVFVNTEVKDGTTVSEYMECFLKKEVNNSKFPAFTKRMNALKHEERGLNAVCEVMEKYEQKAVEEGLSLFEKAITMLASGKSPSEVVLTGVPQNIVDRASRAMKPKLNK